MTCVEPGCTRPVKVVARQLCNVHYVRQRKAGTLRPLDRFADRVDKSGDCWEWTGRKEKGGYGRWGDGMAHRTSWERVNGAIPEDMTIDHMCRNPGCVNPSHLRLLPPSENFRDTSWARRTECLRGHPWSAENTRLSYRKGSDRPYRSCRACDRIRQARVAARRSSAA